MGNSKNLVITAVVVLALAGAYYFFKKPSHPGSLNTQYDQDLSIIKDPDAKAEEFMRALIRLGKDKDKTAYDIAVKRHKDGNQLVRAACVEALGFYEGEEVEDILSNGLSDIDKIVRLAAARGIARAPSENRVQLILSKTNDKEYSIQEKTELYVTLSRIGGESGMKTAVDWLMNIAKSGDKQDNTEAMFRLASIAPSDPRVVDLLKSKLRGSQDPRMVGFALRHLGALRDKGVVGDLKKYADNVNPDIRISAIQATALSCAPNRWDILEGKAKSEKDPRVLKALIDAPKIILGEQAAAFLKTLSTDAGLTPDLLEVVKINLAEVEKNVRNSPCEQR